MLTLARLTELLLDRYATKTKEEEDFITALERWHDNRIYEANRDGNWD